MNNLDSNLVSRAAPEGGRGGGGAIWLVLLMIVAHFVAVALMAPGFAFGDDIPMAQGAAAFGSATSPAEAWAALSVQHNEHRPVIVRLVFWAFSGVPEAYRYTAIAMTGCLFLVLMCWLMAREGAKAAAPAAFAIVLGALFFNFGISESSLWAMAAVSNFGVLAMLVAALVMLSAGGVWGVLALAPAMLAVGLQGNGVLVPLLGVVWLACNRRFLSALVWAAAAGLALWWYFTGYVHTSDGVTLADAGARIGELVVYVLAFLGSAAGFGGKSLGALNLVFISTSAVLGALMVGVTLWAVARGALFKGGVAVWINLFIIATAVLTAVSRVDFGVQQALVPRYHINSCLMVASTLVWLLGDPERRSWVSDLLRKRMTVLAVLGLVYFLGTIPILLMMHNMYVTPQAAG